MDVKVRLVFKNCNFKRKDFKIQPDNVCVRVCMCAYMCVRVVTKGCYPVPSSMAFHLIL